MKRKSPVNFINKSQNASAYLWTFGANDSSHVTSPTYIYTDSGNYVITLVAYSNNGCQNDTAYGIIKVIDGTITIYIPNAFSPNNDGINDVFDINGVGIANYHYSIYNRWGEEVFRTSESPFRETQMEMLPGMALLKEQQVPERSIYLST